jgi:hypothetical protein
VRPVIVMRSTVCACAAPAASAAAAVIVRARNKALRERKRDVCDRCAIVRLSCG